MRYVMSGLITNFLYLLIYPFRDKQLFVFIAGMLICTWLFSTVFSIIRGDYK